MSPLLNKMRKNLILIAFDEDTKLVNTKNLDLEILIKIKKRKHLNVSSVNDIIILFKGHVKKIELIQRIKLRSSIY